jgi:hypothetical protein
VLLFYLQKDDFPVDTHVGDCSFLNYCCQIGPGICLQYALCIFNNKCITANRYSALQRLWVGFLQQLAGRKLTFI